ncbi:MAG: aminodeoxychorismate synthase component I [Gammaproteobacteria bacterium]|nr:MAG: aminodeoxychorismate synthase component I [Gammaproteobacteria bacterium]
MSTLQTLPYQTDPLPLLAALRPYGGAVLLHSADRTHPDGRFDVVAAAPTAWLTTRGPGTCIHGPDGSRTTTASPFDTLEQWLESPAAELIGEEALPFAGGVIGLAGYDLVRVLEPLPPRRSPASGFPDLIAGRYAWAVVTDHHTGTTRLLQMEDARPPPIVEMLAAGLPAAPCLGRKAPHLRGETDPDAYARSFQRIQDYIRAGDCYQVNLAMRFTGRFDGDPLALYAHLAQRHPAPFAGFLDTAYGTVLSFSPERFLRTADGVIETCPIKGTQPRSSDPVEDRQLAAALLASAKDRAENLMIVDLLRNDLGRSCVAGSIEVSSLFGLESFGSVHHLVSRIRGRLAPDISPLAAFARAFPGGSITGAPKIRAMQIIDELEPHARGPYCGSLFMVDGRGRMDSSITIRTLLARHGHLHCWGGGGLVADSTLTDEWAEIHHKVGALIGKAEAES